jgi:hypothetical protein
VKEITKYDKELIASLRASGCTAKNLTNLMVFHGERIPSSNKAMHALVKWCEERDKDLP